MPRLIETHTQIEAAGEPPKILVRHVYDLERAEEKLSKRLRIQLTASEVTRDRMEALSALLSRHPGTCAVEVLVVFRLLFV